MIPKTPTWGMPLSMKNYVTNQNENCIGFCLHNDKGKVYLHKNCNVYLTLSPLEVCMNTLELLTLLDMYESNYVWKE